MRLRLVIRDEFYRDALSEMIGRSDHDVYAEIGDEVAADEGMMIITDMMVKDIGETALRRFGDRTVILTDDRAKCTTVEKGPFHVFKFDNIESIMADLRLIYYMWSGEENDRRFKCRTITVFCDADERRSREFSISIARHIAYESGEEVLYLPLTYICRRTDDNDSDDRLRRLLYYTGAGRHAPREAFFVKDNYGVSFFRTAGGLNGITALERDEYDLLTGYLSDRCFETIVFDLGTALTGMAIETLNGSDHCFMIRTETENMQIEEHILDTVFKEGKRDLVNVIDAVERNGMLEYAADEYAMRIMGDNGEEE